MKTKTMVAVAIMTIGCFLVRARANEGNVRVLTGKEAAVEFGPTYVYSSIGGGRIAVRRKESIVMLGDIGLQAKFCDKKSQFYCVSSPALKFAVPKVINKNTKEWIINGEKYEVVAPLRNLQFFGRILKIMVIVSLEKDSNGSISSTFFTYSPTYGLLAFEGVNGEELSKDHKKQPTMYLLAGNHGFGVQ
ncbi:MAG: hypothetical protein ACRETO_02835 [Gammaproteobacteria bacterium]